MSDPKRGERIDRHTIRAGHPKYGRGWYVWFCQCGHLCGYYTGQKCCFCQGDDHEGDTNTCPDCAYRQGFK